MFLGAFQHTQVAVLHVTLPLLCLKPLKEPSVLQGPSEAPFIQIHCLPALPYTHLHTQLSRSPGALAVAVLPTGALASSQTWSAFPALPHMGSSVIPHIENCCYIPAKYGLLYPFYR